MAKARLPKHAQLTRIIPPRSHVLRTSGRELKDFYYILEVDAVRMAKQSSGPRVPLSWFDSLADVSSDSATDFEDWWFADLASIRSGAAPVDCPAGFTHPLAKILTMSDLNAVLMAELAHVGLLAARGVGSDAGDLVDSKLLPRVCTFDSGGVDGLAEEVFFPFYIDDLDAISLIPLPRCGISPSVGGKVALAVDAVYAAERWPQGIEKTQSDVIDTKMWGTDLEGNTGIVSVSRERRMHLFLLTLTYIHKKWSVDSLVVYWACGPTSFSCADQVTLFSENASKYSVHEISKLRSISPSQPEWSSLC